LNNWLFKVLPLLEITGMTVTNTLKVLDTRVSLWCSEQQHGPETYLVLCEQCVAHSVSNIIATRKGTAVFVVMAADGDALRFGRREELENRRSVYVMLGDDMLRPYHLVTRPHFLQPVLWWMWQCCAVGELPESAAVVFISTLFG
jgi:hypothetical protein